MVEATSPSDVAPPSPAICICSHADSARGAATRSTAITAKGIRFPPTVLKVRPTTRPMENGSVPVVLTRFAPVAREETTMSCSGWLWG